MTIYNDVQAMVKRLQENKEKYGPYDLYIGIRAAHSIINVERVPRRIKKFRGTRNHRHEKLVKRFYERWAKANFNTE